MNVLWMIIKIFLGEWREKSMYKNSKRAAIQWVQINALSVGGRSVAWPLVGSEEIKLEM